MVTEQITLPIGQQVSLPGHFNVPVVLEAARPLAKGFECRVRLPDGTLEEAVVLSEQATKPCSLASRIGSMSFGIRSASRRPTHYASRNRPSTSTAPRKKWWRGVTLTSP